MAGSHADDIVGEFFESDEWAKLAEQEAESEEPDLDPAPVPPRPEAA